MRPGLVCRDHKNGIPQAGWLQQRPMVSQSGGWTSKAKVPAGLASSEAAGGSAPAPCPAFPSPRISAFIFTRCRPMRLCLGLNLPTL